MAGLSTTWRNKLLDAMFNQTNITAPTAIFLGLNTADPGTTGAAEVSGSSYARVDVTAAFPAAASGLCSNTSAIPFPTATTPGYTVTHWSLWDASTAGNFICGGDTNPDKAIGIGGIPEFAIGELDLSST